MQLKSLLNTVYFGADHVVWASQAGILGDKLLVDRAQKIRYYSCLRLQCTHFKSGSYDIKWARRASWAARCWSTERKRSVAASMLLWAAVWVCRIRVRKCVDIQHFTGGVTRLESCAWHRCLLAAHTAGFLY